MVTIWPGLGGGAYRVIMGPLPFLSAPLPVGVEPPVCLAQTKPLLRIVISVVLHWGDWATVWAWKRPRSVGLRWICSCGFRASHGPVAILSAVVASWWLGGLPLAGRCLCHVIEEVARLKDQAWWRPTGHLRRVMLADSSVLPRGERVIANPVDSVGTAR